jgi:predicted RNA-binding protein with RPS1 domain
MLQGLKRGDGTYHIEAIIADVHEENLSLILQGSDPSLGRIYAAQVSTQTLPEPRSVYQAGQAIILRLTFPGESFTEDMQKLPTEVKKVIDLQQGFQRLFWDAPRLHFYGRMSYSTRNKLLALSTERAYQQAIRKLYLLSQQFAVEVVTTKTQGPAEQLTLAEEMEQETIPTDALSAQGELEDATVALTYRREILRTPPQVSTFATRYQIGDRVRGWVTGVLDYGAFVEFPSGLKGLVHKSKMWGYVADARDVIRVGEELEVIILDVRPDGNLELSLRLPENDPLLKYEVGDKVKGMVINIQEHGALIEIEPDVRGLVHKSKMWGYVLHVEDVVHYGEEVTVLILSIDQEKRRLELSMQVAEHDRLQYYQAGDIVVGTVTEVMDYGAFVEIEPGVSGLVYRDDLPGYVTDARKMLSRGDEVEVLIIRVDRVKRHLSLSMRDI